MWYTEFDSVFWITVGTLLTGCIGLTVKYCLKSKCDFVKICWGIIEIHRNTEQEIDELELGENIEKL
jgi:hypothetical protein